MVQDTEVPVVGDGFYYLVRGVNACGTGSYGWDTEDVERTTMACP